MPVETDIAGLAQAIKALADPVRLEMIRLLAEGRDATGLPDICTRDIPGEGVPAGVCVCELQEQSGMAQSRVSYHLRILKEAGLITEEARGKWTFYELDHQAVAATLRSLQDLTGESAREEPTMSDDSICTELGCMTPAQVVQCAEASNTECWVAARMVDPDGDEVEYECCGGGGKKARFSLLKRGRSRPVDAADVPSSLTWARRMI